MRVKQNYPNLNFQRALSSRELKLYKDTINQAKNCLGIVDTTAIVFDFNVPQESSKNTSIGSSWSNSSQEMIDFLKNMGLINSIQMQPQGKISYSNHSPYSGTNFSFGEHIIDLEKLTTSYYGKLLSIEDINRLDYEYQNKEKREYRTDYAYILPRQHELLRKAYNNFINSTNSNLAQEFANFKKGNSSWLEKEGLFEILAKSYGTEDFSLWEERDKNLFSSKVSENVRKERIKQLKENNQDELNFQSFVQFIAHKEQKESKENYNSKNIKVYGDCLIGFSKSEMWANKDCFIDGQYYGGPDPNCPETNGIQTWGLPALNYDKIGFCDGTNIDKLLPAGKLLYKKYCDFFRKYDGLRMDAAWQFVTPFIYKKEGMEYKEVKTPKIDNTILNILKRAGIDTLGKNFDQDNVMLELVGISAGESRALTLNAYPHLYTTAYAQYDETPKKFLEKGYQDGKFYVGVSNHDNESLNNMARDKELRKIHSYGIKRDYNPTCDFGFKTVDYQRQSKEEKAQENFKTAKFGEIFTSKKQFFTLPDLFGMSERINISGKESKDNWTIRIPRNFERFYYSQLQNGYGLNFPKALLCAMNMKEGIKSNKKLENDLAQFSEILRQKGPTTTIEADKLEKEGKLTSPFSRII